MLFLNDDLANGKIDNFIQFEVGEDGNLYWKNLKEGADSVSKKLGSGGDFKKIYEGEAKAEALDSSWSVSVDSWEGEFTKGNSGSRSYNIPLEGDDFVYSITFTASVSTFKNTSSSNASATITGTLKTVEGNVIKTVTTTRSGNTGSDTNTHTIDLLAAKFSTNSDHLILTISINVSARAENERDDLGRGSGTVSNIAINKIVLK